MAKRNDRWVAPALPVQWVTPKGVICYCCGLDVMRPAIRQHDGYCPNCKQPIDFHDHPYNLLEGQE